MSGSINKTFSKFYQKVKKSFTSKKTKDFSKNKSEKTQCHKGSDEKPNLLFLGCFPLPKKRTKTKAEIQTKEPPSCASHKEVPRSRTSTETESSSQSDGSLFPDDDTSSQSSIEITSKKTVQMFNTDSSELTKKLTEYKITAGRYSNEDIESTNTDEFENLHKEIEGTNKSIFEIKKSNNTEEDLKNIQEIQVQLQSKLKLCRIRKRYEDLIKGIEPIRKTLIGEMNSSDIQHIKLAIENFEKLKNKIEKVRPESNHLKNKIKETIIRLKYMTLTKELDDKYISIKRGYTSLTQTMHSPETNRVLQKEINDFIEKTNHLEKYISDNQLNKLELTKIILSELSIQRQELMDINIILQKRPKRLREHDESEGIPKKPKA
jgi:hypothetical protein